MANSPEILVSIDLKPVPLAEAQVPINDRGFLFGDSVYEVVRTYQGKLFAFDEHFVRLKRSAENIYLNLPFGKSDLHRHLTSMVTNLNQTNCYIRIVVTRGPCEYSIDPPLKEQPRTVIVVKKLKEWPELNYQRGISLVTPQVRRNPKAALDSQIKSGNYLNSVIAMFQARQKGADDAAILAINNELTESTTANLFLIKNGVLLTPWLQAGILDGITRQIILALARDHQIPLAVQALYIEDAASSEECFIASTTREIMPVAKLNETSFTVPGPLTRKLMALYKEFVSKALASQSM